MQSHSARYARDLYLPWLDDLITSGEEVDVRGRKTIEILDAISVVEEPWHHCILIPERRWNPWLALSEALWILAGRNDVAALAPYNSHIRDYSDDGISLYGAYGARIYDQIDPLIARLRRDPSDRRAVLSIWDARSTLDRVPVDLLSQSKDPPCNNLVYFKLRNNKLHMTVMCRSNDLHWGLFAVNLPTFGILQEYIAARLGVGIGTQTHLSNSLHIYTDDKTASAITQRMIHSFTDEWPEYPEHERAFESLEHIESHAEFAKICSDILEDGPGVVFKTPIPFLFFAQKFLWAYITKDFDSEWFLKEWSQYKDWIIAGESFKQAVWK